MSYLVLARKWRPESFSDVVGQKHVVLTLEAAIRNDRTAHAYLFAGPRGVGKTTIARLLAKALNCQEGPTAEPCGECASCTEIASGKSLDVIEIDGASNRKIEDARGIRETVQYAPLSGRMKIYIIDEAHMLTREAFNALLKTLEEPPPHVVFILATTEPGKIPETISSRCQRFDFHRISSVDMESRLLQIATAEGLEVGGGALAVVAARADGSMRDAVSLLDQLVSVGTGTVTVDDVARVLGIPDVELFFALTDAIAEHDTAATLAALSSALESGFDPRDLVDGLVEHLRNLLLVRATPEPERLVGRASDYAAHEGASSRLEEDDLVRLLRIGIEAQAAVKWSTQAGLMVELALVRMAKLTSTVELTALVKALQEEEGGSEPPSRGPLRKSAQTGQKRSAARRGDVAPGKRDDSARGATAGGTTGGSVAAGGDGVPVADVDAGRWPDVLARIRDSKPGLAASLADSSPGTAGRGKLEIEVPNGSRFHKEQLRDRGNMRLMESAAGEVFGGRVRLSFTFAEAAAERGGAPRNGRPEGEGQDDPVVKRVVDMFGGQIVDSKREE
jgi:DNA polymerase-3 subunit gamma/tau